MKEYGVFDIIGPVMIGPSSSHTAGAARIAQVAISIVKKGFYRVDFHLHGSFAKTYKGHGTDKALLAGVLGFKPNDKRLRDSFAIAKKEGLEFHFIKDDLGTVHPNTAKLVFYYKDGTTSSVTGSSIGGGNIEIIEINDVLISYNGKFPTIILKYGEQKGVIYEVSKLLATNNYNIESIKTVKQDEEVTLIVELNERLKKDLIDKIINDKRYDYANYIEGVK
ncbi:L-serine ammonia-lyase, iron-sulfur-dependent subunit beta [Anaerococcus porci]|uniref:L-serine deaminase n=1 Tax=Anaerococcus porci TaxID=2652269 RepID=A0A6N7VTE7_9FIRM|nr:L-serine ammonia-lyase, iron-sulfur-dependent subunit beta [Anaerococcus porci]MDY3005963.1 L-serine ammonia-lyase, iron-sulfur-dependent subunit beta [Anaerococcus porci]MSS77097.1 L-serine ammonia-lyase, iron-sulfur-dependent, subunit beta [Anaerococcus porci]